MSNPLGREAIFEQAVCGNRAALAFLHALFRAADIADDLHDQDKPANVGELLHGLTMMNVYPFFRQHADALTALMVTGALSWDVSNEIDEPERAFYAAQLEQVLFYVALLCGGYEHAKSIMREWIAKG